VKILDSVRKKKSKIDAICDNTPH